MTPYCFNVGAVQWIYHTVLVLTQQLCETHSAVLAVGQQLVFFLRVEEECLWCEVDGLSLEGRTLICADKQHLISFVYRRAHHDHLKETERGRVGVEGNKGQR